MQPGRVARRDYEYKRCGTANVFCGVEPKAGRHFTKVTPTRCSAEFADYLLEIAARYPAADTIHLVMDNLSTHTRKALVERFGEKAGGWLWNRFTVHYTPKHGSWLNQAEMEVSLFSRQCLGKRRIGDIAALRKQARAWNRRVNQPRPRFSGSSRADRLEERFTTQSRGQSTRWSNTTRSASRQTETRGVSCPAKPCKAPVNRARRVAGGFSCLRSAPTVGRLHCCSRDAADNLREVLWAKISALNKTRKLCVANLVL